MSCMHAICSTQTQRRLLVIIYKSLSTLRSNQCQYHRRAWQRTIVKDVETPAERTACPLASIAVLEREAFTCAPELCLLCRCSQNSSLLLLLSGTTCLGCLRQSNATAQYLQTCITSWEQDIDFSHIRVCQHVNTAAHYGTITLLVKCRTYGHHLDEKPNLMWPCPGHAACPRQDTLKVHRAKMMLGCPSTCRR